MDGHGLLLHRYRGEVADRRRRAPTEALHLVALTDSHVWNAYDGLPADPASVNGSRYYYASGAKLSDLAAQVNAMPVAPAAVVHTGDFTERGDDFSLFLARMDAIRDDIPVVLHPGNHDCQTPSGSGSKQQQLADVLGVSGRPVNAGSVFNWTTTLTQNGVTIRLITIDTTRPTATGSNVFSGTGYFNDETLAWVDSVIATSTEERVLFLSHHGPHNYNVGSFFDDADAFAFRDIVDAAVASHPNRRFRYLFGHNHKSLVAGIWHNLGPNLPGLLGPALVELNPGGFMDVYVFPDGYLYWQIRRATYPYPGA